MKLESFTARARLGAVFDVTESVLAPGGSIQDHQQFSNHLLRLSIKIRKGRLNELVAGIEATGISPSKFSTDNAEARSKGNPEGTISGNLAIGFVSDEPDLRIEVPPFPG